MLKLKLDRNLNEKVQILCLGAHSDDIEIGCGGTMLKLLSEYNNTIVKWIVFSANSERKTEANKSADLFLADATDKKIIVKKFEFAQDGILWHKFIYHPDLF